VPADPLAVLIVSPPLELDELAFVVDADALVLGEDELLPHPATSSPAARTMPMAPVLTVRSLRVIIDPAPWVGCLWSRQWSGSPMKDAAATANLPLEL
jgi:hypothetical protein